jgi:hypothetical protein
MLTCFVTVANNKKIQNKYGLQHQWAFVGITGKPVLSNAYRSIGFILNGEVYIYYSRQNDLIPYRYYCPQNSRYNIKDKVIFS